MSDKKIEPQDKDEFDIFIAYSIYPKANNLFATGPNKLIDIKDECIIVPDTNVLLLPFTTGKESLEEIEKIYKNLAENNQLIIPGQVAREFVKNRPNKLADLFQKLNRKMDVKLQKEKESYPLLKSLSDYKRAIIIEKEIENKIKEYKKSLKNAKNQIHSWIWNDPISQIYEDLFKENIILDIEFDKDEIKRQIGIQKLHCIPPGYKDGSKDDSGVGDILIWRTILEIGQKYKKNVIFVSGEEKADWCYRSEGQVLYPRYELVDEFKRYSGGKLFHMVQFSALLNLYGADENVVDEIRKQELLRHFYDEETNLFLAGARITIEKKLRTIGELYNIEKIYPIRNFIRSLSDIENVPKDIIKRIERIFTIASKAIHSDKHISNEERILVRKDAPVIIEYLDELISNIENDENNK